MKDAKDIKADSFLLKPTERQEMNQMAERLKSLAEEGKINEELLHAMINILLELGSMKDNVMWKLLRFAKQNHMLT